MFLYVFIKIKQNYIFHTYVYFFRFIMSVKCNIGYGRDEKSLSLRNTLFLKIPREGRWKKEEEN